jgi:hypothetical protein
MNCGVTEGNIHHFLRAAGNLYTNNEKCKCLSSWAIRSRIIQSERHWINGYWFKSSSVQMGISST